MRTKSEEQIENIHRINCAHSQENGSSIKVSVEIITELFPPPSLMVKSPIINTVAELTIAGTILIRKTESPTTDFHIQRIQIDKEDDQRSRNPNGLYWRDSKVHHGIFHSLCKQVLKNKQAG